ncbi:MAG TPA: SAM-dependent chlorinase/fluorinase [Terriglobales bacterium]|nr:SAM-dependent chlorinase/fluorinase [Terriglobales bacterium]
MSSLITVTTDFGLNDHFVGAMKGVILSINPQAQIVDICNSVPSFDVLDGALTVAHATPYFPADAIHLIVVDPGVGSQRRPILVTNEKHMFLAPDNGVMSLVYDRSERLSVRHITSEHYFLQPVSQTFHGRDIFGACAGWLSKGVEAAKFGEEISDFIRFAAPKPKAGEGNSIKGVVLKIDKFGNLITNFTAKDVPQLFEAQPPAFRIQVGKAEVTVIKNAYAQGPAGGGLFGILGSMGYLEISANRAAASRVAAAERGSEVTITFG